MIVIGRSHFIFGMPGEAMMFVRPLWFPVNGKVKLRFRRKEFARAFLRSNGVIRAFYLTEMDEHHFTVVETDEIGRNEKV